MLYLSPEGLLNIVLILYTPLWLNIVLILYTSLWLRKIFKIVVFKVMENVSCDSKKLKLGIITHVPSWNWSLRFYQQPQGGLLIPSPKALFFRKSASP